MTANLRERQHAIKIAQGAAIPGSWRSPPKKVPLVGFNKEDRYGHDVGCHFPSHSVCTCGLLFKAVLWGVKDSWLPEELAKQAAQLRKLAIG